MIAEIDPTPTKIHKLDHRRANIRLPLHLVDRIVMMQRRRAYPYFADLVFQSQLHWLATRHFRHSFTSHDLDCNHRHASWARRSAYWVELRQWACAVVDIGLSKMMAHMRRRTDGACTKRCVIHSDRMACLYEHCEYDDACKCHDCDLQRAQDYYDMQNDAALDYYHEMLDAL